MVSEAADRAGPVAPQVSIVLSTYNRPQVLELAIRSVLQQTFTDWELIVVGDGCTDDTEARVEAFGDPRIRWHGLSANSGNQAAPNNAGVAMARGRHVLFLNHDDLWFGDHVARSVEALERTGADVVFSPVALLAHSGREEGPPDPRADRIVLDGVAPDGYDPRVFVIASSWAVTRAACDRVGPWRPPAATRLSPSQEWLFRAARGGCRIAYDPRVSVLCIHAGTRRLSYLRDSPEHERAWGWVDGHRRAGAELLEAIALRQAAEAREAGEQGAPGARNALRARLVRLGERLGAHPHAVERLLRREGKGGWIAAVHDTTFAAAVLPAGEDVPLRAGHGTAYLIDGWHPADAWGVWSAASRAVLGFRVPGGLSAPSLELTGGPLRPGTVRFEVHDGSAVSQPATGPGQTFRVPLGAAGRDVTVTIEVERLTSPRDLGASDDPRRLGFGLTSLRLVEDPEPAA